MSDTSQPSIVGIIDEVVAVLRPLPGILYVPDDPTGQIITHPAAVVWLSEFRAILGPGDIVEYHFTVRVGLLTSMDDIATANQRILPQIEPVIEAIKRRLWAGQFRNALNIDELTGTYGPIQWGDVWFFGALIDLGDVKIQRRS